MREASGGSLPRRTAVAAWTMLVCAGVAACTAEAEPIVSEMPSVAGTAVAVSASPSPSPSVSVKVAPLTNEELWALMPDGADHTDLWGAMITAEFFLEQYAPMFHTGDTRVWEALSEEGCGYCAGELENAEWVRDKGWAARGGSIEVDDSTVRAHLNGTDRAYYLAEVVRDTAYLTPPGEPEKVSAEAHRAKFEFALYLTDGRWRVAGVVTSLVDTE